MDIKVRECETCYELFEVDTDDSCATTCLFCRTRETHYISRREQWEACYWRRLDQQIDIARGK